MFVTGTDTGVGKTVVTAALAHCLSDAGKRVSVVKPVQTGTSCQKVSDIQFVYKLLGRDINYTDHCPYSYSHPLSPKTAAELENSCIDIQVIKSAISKQVSLN
ncbi:MAG: dethiobiotin synthase, partial [Candidatus Dadabacteria bacterium]|nr:dethiobiotin synthase [Candidatus Dadabacteria bacterium]NIV43011.1 dethiobiotin synthase [Candidatus Dadabacteria bacterium]NIX15505.1 dethiobiotin synthase [Candidatus Dadabacteria bacterium]